MEVKSCTIRIEFFTAHFKRHETKKFRGVYIIPPPTAIWGMVGAISGVPRERLYEFVSANSLITGANLIDFKGFSTEKATLLKHEDKAGGYIRTIEDFEFMIEPTFEIAIGGKADFINMLKEKVEKGEAEYEPYGGISDCFLKEMKVENAEARLEMTNRVRGMVPADLVKQPHVQPGKKSSLVKVLYLNAPFYQGFNVEFEMKEPVRAK